MRRGYWFLFVVFSALQLVSAGDSTVVQNVQGLIGGSVIMRCVLEHPYNVDRLYFQMTRDGTEIFVNGFYSSKLPLLSEYKNRTFVNRTELSMEMRLLTPADAGVYTCIPFSGSVPYNKTKIHLTVTATYSVPIITLQGCNDAAVHNCVIGCSSSGGFPRSNVSWGVVGDEMSGMLKDEGEHEFIQDERSQLWNISHTVPLNCSQQMNITCSIGGVVSHPVSVCIPPPTQDFIMAIAFIVLLLISFLVTVIVVIKCRRACHSAEPSTDAELASLK